MIYAAARPDVIDEVFDGEAVLVHLRTGCYYALDRAASGLWTLLAPGRDAETIVQAVVARTGDEPAAVAEQVAAFVAELVAEELVVPAAVAAPPPAADELSRIAPGAPVLQRFTDMQDLLMLDPIHDVDVHADGWPVGPDGARVEPAA